MSSQHDRSSKEATLAAPVPTPPQPPNMPRRILLSTFQFLFLPVLVLLPVLAFFGVFGLAKVTNTVEAGPLAVTAEYPRRIRYGVSDGARIRISNDGATPVSGVRLAIGRDWLEHFGNVSFVPSPFELTADEYRFELGDIPAGESRLIVVELTADGYLDRSGAVTVTGEATGSAHLELTTFIFP